MSALPFRATRLRSRQSRWRSCGQAGLRPCSPTPELGEGSGNDVFEVNQQMACRSEAVAAGREVR
jgi:hypothetical protein